MREHGARRSVVRRTDEQDGHEPREAPAQARQQFARVRVEIGERVGEDGEALAQIGMTQTPAQRGADGGTYKMAQTPASDEAGGRSEQLTPTDSAAVHKTENRRPYVTSRVMSLRRVNYTRSWPPGEPGSD